MGVDVFLKNLSSTKTGTVSVGSLVGCIVQIGLNWNLR